MKDFKLNYQPWKSSFLRAKSKSANLLWENLISMMQASTNHNSPKFSIDTKSWNRQCWPMVNYKRQWKEQVLQLVDFSSSIANALPRIWSLNNSAWLCNQRVALIGPWWWASIRFFWYDRRSSWMPVINWSRSKMLLRIHLMCRRSKRLFETILKITRIWQKMTKIWFNKWTIWKRSCSMIRNWVR